MMSRVMVMLALVASVPAWAGPGDGLEISRSRGAKGGAVVLWPRVVPDTSDASLQDLAYKLQNKLSALTVQVVDDRKTSVRPMPERVCPQAGCKGASVSVLLGHQGGGCVAVALIGAPGEGPVQLVPWAGKIAAPGATVPFRQAPENQLVVQEFVPCDQLLTSLDDAAVTGALSAVASVAP